MRSQRLAGPRPGPGLDAMRQLLHGIRVLQVDPVDVVARNQLLVLWSRLGGSTAPTWTPCCGGNARLFEYWAHSASIVLTSYPSQRS